MIAGLFCCFLIIPTFEQEGYEFELELVFVFLSLHFFSVQCFSIQLMLCCIIGLILLISNPVNCAPIRGDEIIKNDAHRPFVYDDMRLRKRQLEGEDGLWGKRQQVKEVDEETTISKQNSADRLQSRDLLRSLLRLRIDIDNLLSEYTGGERNNRKQTADHSSGL